MDTRLLPSIAAVCALAGSAFAGYSSAVVESGSDPSTWGFANQIASLDALAGGYQWPETSGFAWYVAGSPVDETQLVSEAYRINSQQTIGVGADQITVNPGDTVFAYRIRLVTATPSSTVTSLVEFQALGTSFFPGSDVMPASFVNGQGFVSNSHGNNPESSNLDGDDVFGSGVDFQWAGGTEDNLDNDDEIVLLLFAGPAGVGFGFGDFTAPPGQPGGLSGKLGFGEQPQILIPVVPAPGAAALAGLAAVGVASRRRR